MSYRPPTFAKRVFAMGSSGWEAYTVGFTLVGCIVAGAGAGWWLDQRFGTDYWLPVLFLIGTVGGFREMFVTLGRVNRERDATKARELAARSEQTLKTVEGKVQTKPEIEVESSLSGLRIPPPPEPQERPRRDKP